MTIIFTETESKYIIKKRFDWKMAQNTPKDVEKTLKPKLELLYRNDQPDTD